MGSDKCLFNVPLIVRDKVSKQHPQATIFDELEEPKQNWTKVLLLASITTRTNQLTHTQILFLCFWFNSACTQSSHRPKWKCVLTLCLSIYRTQVMSSASRTVCWRSVWVPVTQVMSSASCRKLYLDYKVQGWKTGWTLTSFNSQAEST